MKLFLKGILSAMMFVFVMSFATGCDIDLVDDDLFYDRECLESCTFDSDCEYGLSCVDDRIYGYVCLPSECEECHANDDSCNYSTDYSYGGVTCDFQYCSY